jgi:cytochrome oxidase Cu insertion factor (SCO1/SenC/PrrC family)
MHPSVTSKRPGQKCPKCKMTLVRDGEADAEATTAAEASAQPAAAGGEPATPTPTASTAAASLASIPDVELLNQDGEKVRFYSDLVKGKTVAVNFIFTTCTTICPPLGATFARVQKDLGERTGRDVHFISVSVDPATDTPERLKAWGAKFKAGPGWTFVTGQKPQVDELLRALAASASRREDHTPMVLIGNDATGQWTRTYGLAKPSQLVKIIEEVSAAPAAAPAAATQTPAQPQQQPAAAPKAPPNPLAAQPAPPGGQTLSTAHSYFTDVELLNQDGEKVRFYSDVLKGKTVVINAFFATCTGVCPPMNRSMKAIQEALGDRVGKDVFLVSITVDPAADTPTRLKEYAKQYQAKPGWVFLTGKKENVDWALYKLGQYVEDKNGHKSVIIIGNEATGLWKKAFGLAKAEELIAIVNGVMNDKGAESK